MSVIAKFFVQKVTRPEGDTSTAAQIDLSAVCRGIENAGWASATPAGRITFNSLNDAATAYFEEGAEYEVLFTKVAKPMPGDGHKPRPVKDKWGNQICATCGAYATDKGSWEHHDEMFGAKPAG